jgi:hypothetical protein
MNALAPKSPGQIAYEAELQVWPFYPDGARRVSWDNLCALAHWSWERNPTPRKCFVEGGAE